MISIKEVVVVEGKYDKIKLSSVIDATIIECNGFGIYKDKALIKSLRTFAKTVGIIILTDSDDAGFKIRNYIKGSIHEGTVIDVYIPEFFGKEKRKLKPSSAGLLGVEGVDIVVIREAFEKAGITHSKQNNERPITKLDLFELGLSGGENSTEMRKKILLSFDLPSRISPNTFIKALNNLTTFEELKKRVEQIKP